MEYPLTIVSGYWDVPNKHDLNFVRWFKNTLRINCPYVFFGTKDTIELAQLYRDTLPTHYVECELEEFYTYKYKDKMITHLRHCPSAELNMIWNEKLFFIEKAFHLNPFQSEFFAWVDAGICTYRYEAPPSKPFPNLEKLATLPKDKFIFTSSDNTEYEPERLFTYYHYVSGTYVLHKSIISKMISLYKEYFDKTLQPDNIYTDQVILTRIYNDHSNLFYKIGDGYGELLPILYS